MFKEIYISKLFLITLIIVLINSLSISNTITSQAIENLANIGAGNVIFEVTITSLIREIIPISIGLILAWVLVINRQYIIKRKTTDNIYTLKSHIMFVLSLAIFSLLISSSFAYLLLSSYPTNYDLKLNDIICFVSKTIGISVILYLFNKLQSKIMLGNKRQLAIMVVCLLLIIGNSVLMLFADYGISFVV